MKFCDHSLPIPARVADLVANLSLSEKAGLLGAGTTGCAFMDAGVERLGIPVYTWCVESNSGAGGICLAENHCQSTFPAAAGLAASFNNTVWRTKGEIVSTELRAMNNIGGMRMGGCAAPCPAFPLLPPLLPRAPSWPWLRSPSLAANADAPAGRRPVPRISSV
jgi:hypothetical protein